jgi:hypothetical protein
LIYQSIELLTYWFIIRFIYRLPIYWLIDLFIDLFTDLSIYWLIHLFIDLFTDLSIYWLIDLYIDLFMDFRYIDFLTWLFIQLLLNQFNFVNET